jgi:hypothetical protein
MLLQQLQQAYWQLATATSCSCPCSSCCCFGTLPPPPDTPSPAHTLTIHHALCPPVVKRREGLEAVLPRCVPHRHPHCAAVNVEPLEALVGAWWGGEEEEGKARQAQSIRLTV